MDKDEQRDLVLREILSLKNNNILAELPTGYGKSKIAIELMKKRKASPAVIEILLPPKAKYSFSNRE